MKRKRYLCIVNNRQAFSGESHTHTHTTKLYCDIRQRILIVTCIKCVFSFVIAADRCQYTCAPLSLIYSCMRAAAYAGHKCIFLEALECLIICPYRSRARTLGPCYGACNVRKYAVWLLHGPVATERIHDRSRSVLTFEMIKKKNNKKNVDFLF